MTVLHVTEATGGLPNSGRLSGTNGDLVGILDVVLLTAGWSITFTSGNSRVYRMGGGNLNYLYVGDDSAVSGAATLATVRICEGASAVGTANLTNPAPKSTQQADSVSNWIKSTAANTTGRAFDLWITNKWIYLFVLINGSNIVDAGFAGDCGSPLPADGYATGIQTRNSNSALNAQGLFFSGSSSPTTSPSKPFYFIRSYDGTVLSSSGYWRGPMGNGGMGVQTGTASMRNGATGKIDMSPVPINDLGGGTASKSASVRAFLPNLWQPMHNGPGTVAHRDTFTDTNYPGGAAAFAVMLDATDTAAGIIQTTDDWVVPHF